MPESYDYDFIILWPTITYIKFQHPALCPKYPYNTLEIFTLPFMNINPPLNFKSNQSKFCFLYSTGQPIDEPECGFQHERCPGRMLSALAISMLTSSGAFVILLSVVVLFLVRNNKLRRELNNQLWKIDYQDLYFHD